MPRAGDAQQAIDYASVTGRVLDPSGAAVAGAQATARHLATNVAAVATTDRDGRFRFPNLRIGPTEIVVRHKGFNDILRLLTLAAGAAFELPVTLEVATVASAITVRADDTLIESARTQVAATLAETEVRDLP